MKSCAAVIAFLLPAVIFAAPAVRVIQSPRSALNAPALIPQPQQMDVREGAFELSARTKITFSGGEDEAQMLAARLRQSTGFNLPVSPVSTLPGQSEIMFLLQNDLMERLGAEGYELTVTQRFVTIRAPTAAGLFYGAQTLLQLLPPEIFSPNRIRHSAWQIPCVEIMDWPRFKWRGLMLDVSRHFYSKAEVERILDEMALHKLNTFHWHLTDDQGWRIEIKKYPKLTEIGAWRSASRIQPPNEKAGNLEKDNAHSAWMADAPGKFDARRRYGGFYTQDDVREVVNYAAARHITVVPEIEMPGHAVAALAAYPKFSPDGGVYTTDVKAGVNSGVFDPGNPATFEFLDDVLAEVFALFPGQFVHVGGDEVNAKVKAATWAKSPSCQALMHREGLTNADELQNWFTREIEKFVNAHGKRLIGWSEIAASGVTTNAAVMDWQGGGLEAASSGHDVVMAPTKFCYLDYYQSTNHSTEPHAIGGFLPLEKVYAFDPIPAKLEPESQSHFLGGQCNLWTEYVASLPHVEYMIWPRACALAEVTWSAKDSRNFDDFYRRLQIHSNRLMELGINFRRD
jgi:hexosaminidase